MSRDNRCDMMSYLEMDESRFLRNLIIYDF
jgi:hypothetical protein